MILKIVIDEARCGATGSCVYWAPKTFDLGDDGIARVIDQQADTPELVRLAVENCPLRAISLVEDIE